MRFVIKAFMKLMSFTPAFALPGTPQLGFEANPRLYPLTYAMIAYGFTSGLLKPLSASMFPAASPLPGNAIISGDARLTS